MDILDEFKLPLENPVLIFSLILFIILFAPILLNRIRIPHLIGLIIAGALIGPNGFHIMERDMSIVLFGTVGLLYIMFMAGLEIDLADFRKNSGKSIAFGLYTFLIPMGLGTLVSYYVLQFELLSSILLASMFASHTLIAYPIVSKLGITKNKAVNVTVGGTMITDTLALLVLAVIAGMSKGDISDEFWIRLGVSITVFALIVLLAFPLIARWFFKRYDDAVSQYIFVLALVFLAAFLAEAAGVEPIIGAFLAGLALNRLIPHTSALMNRIEFAGTALFIPFFLMGVGMLIDFRAFIKDIETLKVALVMTVIAISAKYSAAWLTQKSFRFTKDQRQLIFGLSSAQAAATLAAVLVGYNIITGVDENGESIRLLNESVLNGTILMILVTCTIASFITQKGAQRIALEEQTGHQAEEKELEERILIPISNEATIEELINLSVTIKSKSNKTGLYAMTVVSNVDVSEEKEKKAHKILDRAAVTAAATDNRIRSILRFDLNITNAITSEVIEHKITDLVLGLHDRRGISDSFFGTLTEGLLSKCNSTTLIYKANQPLATIRRHIVIVPQNAEKEIGFPFWLVKIWNIERNTGAKLVFYAPKSTLDFIRGIHNQHPVQAEFNEFNDWDEFLALSKFVKSNDSLFIVLSRRDHISHNSFMHKIPGLLNKYFSEQNFILVFPMQTGIGSDKQLDFKNPSAIDSIKDLDEITHHITKLFRKK